MDAIPAGSRNRRLPGAATPDPQPGCAPGAASLERDLLRDFLAHPIVLDNPYTRWFRDGSATTLDLRHLTVQFSVFSNQFLVAQLLKMINAESPDAMRISKEILANEIGVTFTHRKATVPGAAGTGAACTVDGGTFRFRAAHFEWLMDFAAALGLPFESLGKRRHATPATLHFCDELIRLYGSEEWNVAMGASFAIENWAAAGFWQDLVDGLTRTRRPDLPIGFFVWHNRIEADHSRHTLDELAALAHHSQFDANAFVASGRQALDAVAVFWSGLDRDRRLQYHAAS